MNLKEIYSVRRALRLSARSRADFGGCFRWLIAITAFVACLAGADLGFADDNRAGRIQAALVYYAAKFVQWSPSDGTDLQVCSLFQDGVAEALPATFLGKQIQGRSVVVRKIDAAPRFDQHLAGCNIVYFGEVPEGSTADSLAEWVRKNPGVLTICAVPEVRSNGCLIQIYEQSNKAKLAVDRKLLTQIGLRLSSEFLEVAGTVP